MALLVATAVAAQETKDKEPKMKILQRVSEAGSDRGTAYCVSSRIIRRDGALLIGWLNAPVKKGAPTQAMLGVCDGRTGALIRAFPIGEALDNHCGSALAMDGRGRVHAVIGAHHGKFLYRWSDKPDDPAAWSTPEPLGPRDTYPSLIADDRGTLHLAHREQLLSKIGWQLWYRRKKPGAPWEPPVPLVVSPVPGYNHFMQSLSVGPTGALHLVFQFHYSDTGKSEDGWGRAAVHLRSDDGGDTWSNEGRKLHGPVTVKTMRPVGPADALPREKGLSISNHVTDERDRPCFFSSLPGHPSGVLWQRGEAEWRMLDLAEDLKGLQIGHGGATFLSRDETGRLHLAFSADPRGGPWQWGAPTLKLFHAVFDPAGRRLELEQAAANTTEMADWLPSLESWNWTRPATNWADGLWIMFTRGLNYSTADKGRNENIMKTEIFLGKLPANNPSKNFE